MRFVSFNIRHGEGADGRVSIPRIASVLRGASPDAVCLQEVWRGRLLGNQPARLGSTLGMRHAFQGNVRLAHRDFGNLILARGRLLSSERFSLDSALEPRGCLLVRVEVGGVRFALATTHLGLDNAERARHLQLLADWLPATEPLVLMGDFNTTAEELTPLRGLLAVAEPSPATFPAGHPSAAIDLVAYSQHWRLESVSAIPTAASDHLPLVAELVLR